MYSENGKTYKNLANDRCKGVHNMSEAIIIAILSVVGTVFGSLLGVLASNKLVVYRIEQRNIKRRTIL